MLGGTLVNNSRIDHTKEVLRAEMKLGLALTDNKFAAINRKLDEILTMIGQHNTRIEALENLLPRR